VVTVTDSHKLLPNTNHTLAQVNHPGMPVTLAQQQHHLLVMTPGRNQEILS